MALAAKGCAPGEAVPLSTVFDCRRCGECCAGSGGIVLRETDARRLADLLGLSPEGFFNRFTETVRGKRRLAPGPDGACVFSRNSRCSVHAAKPDVCRAWPFFRGNLVDDASYAMAREACPGIRGGVSFAFFARAGARHLLAESLYVLPGEKNAPAALMEENALHRLAEGAILPSPGHHRGGRFHDAQEGAGTTRPA